MPTLAPPILPLLLLEPLVVVVVLLLLPRLQLLLRLPLPMQLCPSESASAGVARRGVRTKVEL